VGEPQGIVVDMICGDTTSNRCCDLKLESCIELIRTTLIDDVGDGRLRGKLVLAPISCGKLMVVECRM